MKPDEQNASPLQQSTGKLVWCGRILRFLGRTLMILSVLFLALLLLLPLLYRIELYFEELGYFSDNNKEQIEMLQDITVNDHFQEKPMLYYRFKEQLLLSDSRTQICYAAFRPLPEISEIKLQQNFIRAIKWDEIDSNPRIKPLEEMLRMCVNPVLVDTSEVSFIALGFHYLGYKKVLVRGGLSHKDLVKMPIDEDAEIWRYKNNPYKALVIYRKAELVKTINIRESCFGPFGFCN